MTSCAYAARAPSRPVESLHQQAGLHLGRDGTCGLRPARPGSQRCTQVHWKLHDMSAATATVPHIVLKHPDDVGQSVRFACQVLGLDGV